MRSKKIMALVLAATMVAGSAMTVFAADANGATGTGTLLPHVDREVVTVTLPTDAAVQSVFNFTVDPEQIIKDAGQMTGDGATVTGNEDGVYFKNTGSAVPGTVTSNIAADTDQDNPYVITVNTSKNAEYKYDGSKWQEKGTDGSYSDTSETITVKKADGSEGTLANNDTVTVSGAVAAGAVSYSSRSDAVEFKGQNSVDVEVKVTAKVEASAANAKDIVLVADQAALTASQTPALLMTLKVGTDEKAITTAAGTNGVEAKATIAGVPENFITKPNDNGDAYVYEMKDDADPTKWKSATVQLIGKTNKVSVPTDANAMTAPKIELTWTVEKSTVPVQSSVPSTVTIPATGDITVTVTSGSDNAQLTALATSVFSGNMLTTTNSYGATYADGVITLKSGIASALRGMSDTELANTTFTVTFGTGENAYTKTFKFVKATS